MGSNGRYTQLIPNNNIDEDVELQPEQFSPISLRSQTLTAGSFCERIKHFYSSKRTMFGDRFVYVIVIIGVFAVLALFFIAAVLSAHKTDYQLEIKSETFMGSDFVSTYGNFNDFSLDKSLPPPTNTTEKHTFLQKVDHFKEFTRHFNQTFYINDEFYVPGGPIWRKYRDIMFFFNPHTTYIHNASTYKQLKKTLIN
ncbi:hypothetical protein AYI69_g8443 [Smittium culicis]|uniref:Uncharacterized protein n=1 Tax=Smittium culicis TaxID=133412 RepID=A0A1R1XJI8_9FUNG|nr:hypothetical protein AYI69_g8443 [Smittium culicis]